MINNISGVTQSSKEVQGVVTPTEEHRFEFVDMEEFKPLTTTVQPVVPVPVIHPPNLYHIQLTTIKPEN